MYVGTVHARWQNGCRCNFFKKKLGFLVVFCKNIFFFPCLLCFCLHVSCFYVFWLFLFYKYFVLFLLWFPFFFQISYWVRLSVTNPVFQNLILREALRNEPRAQEAFIFISTLTFFFFRIWYCVRSSVTNPRLASLPIFFFRIWYCVRPSVTNPERKKN